MPALLAAADFAALMPARLTYAASLALTAALEDAGVLAPARKAAVGGIASSAAAAAGGAAAERRLVATQPRSTLVRERVAAFVASLQSDGNAGPLDWVPPPSTQPGSQSPPSDEDASARESLVRWTLEILNERWAEHEMTDAFADDVASFLLSHAPL